MLRGGKYCKLSHGCGIMQTKLKGVSQIEIKWNKYTTDLLYKMVHKFLTATPETTTVSLNVVDTS